MADTFLTEVGLEQPCAPSKPSTAEKTPRYNNTKYSTDATKGKVPANFQIVVAGHGTGSKTGTQKSGTQKAIGIKPHGPTNEHPTQKIAKEYDPYDPIDPNVFFTYRDLMKLKTEDTAKVLSKISLMRKKVTQEMNKISGFSDQIQKILEDYEQESGDEEPSRSKSTALVRPSTALVQRSKTPTKSGGSMLHCETVALPYAPQASLMDKRKVRPATAGPVFKKGQKRNQVYRSEDGNPKEATAIDPGHLIKSDSFYGYIINDDQTEELPNVVVPQIKSLSSSRSRTPHDFGVRPELAQYFEPSRPKTPQIEVSSRPKTSNDVKTPRGEPRQRFGSTRPKTPTDVKSPRGEPHQGSESNRHKTPTDVKSPRVGPHQGSESNRPKTPIDYRSSRPKTPTDVKSPKSGPHQGSESNRPKTPIDYRSSRSKTPTGFRSSRSSTPHQRKIERLSLLISRCSKKSQILQSSNIPLSPKLKIINDPLSGDEKENSTIIESYRPKIPHQLFSHKQLYDLEGNALSPTPQVRLTKKEDGDTPQGGEAKGNGPKGFQRNTIQTQSRPTTAVRRSTTPCRSSSRPRTSLGRRTSLESPVPYVSPPAYIKLEPGINNSKTIRKARDQLHLDTDDGNQDVDWDFPIPRLIIKPKPLPTQCMQIIPKRYLRGNKKIASCEIYHEI